MKFTVNRKSLLNELKLLVKAADRRSPIPILACVRIEAAESPVILTTTNLDLWATAELDADVVSSGTLLTPVQALYETVRETAAVELTFEGPKLVGPSGYVQLPEFPSDEFPICPRPEIVSAAHLPQGLPVGRILFAAGDTYHRPLLEVEAGAGQLAATDGHRLALASFPADGNLLATVPVALLKLASSLSLPLTAQSFKERDYYVGLSDDRRSLLARSDDDPKKFPNIRKVIPSDSPHRARVNRKAFRSAVAALLKIANTRTLALTFSKGALEVSAEDGSGSQTLPALWAGPKLKVGFGGSYLLDFLKAAESDEIRIALTNESTAALFTPVGDDTYLYVLMPVRL